MDSSLSTLAGGLEMYSVELGVAVRLAMHDAGLSQHEVARRFGIDCRTAPVHILSAVDIQMLVEGLRGEQSIAEHLPPLATNDKGLRGAFLRRRNRITRSLTTNHTGYGDGRTMFV